MKRNKLISGSNNQATKMINRSLVLKMICTGKSLSRIDIARQTGLSKMSITNIVSELINEGYVMEKGIHQEIHPTGSSGRKPVYLDINTEKYMVIGLYISRDYVHATITNLKCENIVEARCDFLPVESASSFLKKIIALASSLIESIVTTNKIIGIGVSCIGPLDINKGIILEPPNFHELKRIHIKEILEKETGYKVFINNDMNASALAEMLFGNQKSQANFVYVGVTNGIGAGIIANNTLFEGDMGFSGEIGHTTIDINGPKCACGNTGCLELFASIPVVIANAEESILKGSKSTMEKLKKIRWTDIVEHASAGDKLALDLIDSLCYNISFGLVTLINIFDPGTIYLGHEVALAGALVTTRLQAYIEDRLFCRNYKSIPIKISTFGDKAPVAGAASIILDRLFRGKVN